MDNNSNAKVGARLAFLERSLELLNAQMQLFEHAHKNQECHDVFVGPVPATPKQRLDAYALEVS